jgi:uncharacterized protein YcfJ
MNLPGFRSNSVGKFYSAITVDMAMGPAEGGFMKRVNLFLAAVLGVALASPAFARHDDAYFDYARVDRVEPIYETVGGPDAREVCRDEPVDQYHPGYYVHRDRSGPSLFGAIIGGALGHTIGKGDGRAAATIAGAVIGGSVAHRNSHDSYYETEGYYTRDYVQSCRTETSNDGSERVERIVGYDVNYRYHGRNYQSRMNFDPGKRVRVRVEDGYVEVAE